MTLLKGVLKNAFGEIMPGHTILFTALKSTQTVLNTVVSEIVTDTNGAYEKNIYQGRYQIDIFKDGVQKTTVGIIELFADSPDADINTYLTLPGESEVTPEFIQQVIELKNQAVQASDSALASKNSAEESATSAAADAQAAKDSKDSAAASAADALNSKDSATASATAATASEKSASDSAASAHEDMELASTAQASSATNAANAAAAATAAADSASQAESSASSIDVSSFLKIESLSADSGASLVGEFKSFAELRAAKPSANGVRVRLRGWVSGTQKGGGDFIGSLTAATDDGGTIASGSGYHWRRVMPSGSANIEMFGAQVNGLADDTLAVRNAFAWAAGSASGRLLEVSSGVFKLTGEVIINGNDANMNIRGAGSNLTIFSWHESSTSVGLKFGTTTPIARLYISGMNLITNIKTTSPAVLCTCNHASAKQFVMDDIICFGSGLNDPTKGYFGGGVAQVTDANYPIFRDIIFYGVDGSRDNMMLVATGITLTAKNAAVLVPHFINVSCSYCAYPVLAQSNHTPGIEGLVMDRCNGFCVYGFSFTASNSGNGAYYPPQYNISRTQVETFEDGFQFNHVGAVTVSECTILQNSNTASVAGSAIRLVDTIRATVSENYTEARPSKNFNGVTVSGTSSDVDIHYNQFDYSSTGTSGAGIVAEGTSKKVTNFGNRVTGDNSKAIPYINSSTNKKTNSSVNTSGGGQYSHGMGNGLTIKQGSVVLAFDANSEAVVTFTDPFYNTNISATANNANYALTSNPAVIKNKTVSGFTVKIADSANQNRQIDFICIGH